MARFLPLILAVLTALPAWSQGAHFIRATGSLDSSGDYVANFKEAGLGNTPITYELSAVTENFTYQCFTKSSNTPQGAPNSVSFSNDASFTTITPRNGQITGSVSLTPQRDSASCQGQGLVLKLIAVDYEGVTLCDTTNNVCVNLPDLQESVPF
jgi:hypothetical protein